MPSETNPAASTPSQALVPVGIASSQVLEMKRQIISDDQTGKQYLHYHFEDVGAKGRTFKDCNFSYSTFTRAYFFEAKFINCKFIGARFVDCNFRSAELRNCDFKFASFRGTLIPHQEVISNQPEWPNVRKDLMQAHRVNAISVGDDEAVKVYIREEMKARRDHLRRAREGRETYYAKKYSGFLKQVNIWWQSFWLWVDWKIWGHGEYPLKLVRSILIALLILALLVAYQIGAVSLDQTLYESFAKVYRSLKITISIFLGTPYATQQPVATEPQINYWLTSTIALSRYISLSLFVSMLYRRFSRR